jgi:hypothetical protein
MTGIAAIHLGGPAIVVLTTRRCDTMLAGQLHVRLSTMSAEDLEIANQFLAALATASPHRADDSRRRGRQVRDAGHRMTAAGDHIRFRLPGGSPGGGSFTMALPPAS